MTCAMNSPKSLKALSCIAAAHVGVMTTDVLAQPDLRELCHRVLPVDQQVKLLGESREYYPDGKLCYRHIYDANYFRTACWHFNEQGGIEYTSYGVLDSHLMIRFNKNGTHVIRLMNQSKDLFELSLVPYHLCFEVTLRGYSKTFHHHRICLKMKDKQPLRDIVTQHKLNECKCEAVHDIYVLFEDCVFTGYVANDLELD